MAYSDKYKAAWMFFITPVRTPGEVISGALKATIFQFYFFIALVVMLLGVSLVGLSILPNLLLALCNQLLINYAIANISVKQLPFSQPIGNAQKGGQFMRGMFMLMVSGLVGGIHYFVFQNGAAIGIAFIVSAALLGLLMYRIRKITWETILIPD
jgi:ABC-2 type transport system permease protein